jgi:hypothetical protein
MNITLIKNTNFNFQILNSNQSNCSLDKENNTLYKKCLPFKIANSIGWDIILPFNFSVTLVNKNINIECEDKYLPLFCFNIGDGIFSMQIPFFIKTSKNIFLHVRGPINIYKNNICPLEAFVESDWFHGSMRMTWKILEENKKISFFSGESFCRIVPYPKYFIENFQLDIKEEDKSIISKIIKYNIFNRFSNHKLTNRAYQFGFDGEKKIENIKNIKYKKCPFFSKDNE